MRWGGVCGLRKLSLRRVILIEISCVFLLGGSLANAASFQRLGFPGLGSTDPNQPHLRSRITGLSGDGRIVTGSSISPIGGAFFRFDLETGSELAAPTAPPGFGLSMNALSTDGSVVVGGLRLPLAESAYRWTSESSFVEIHDPNGGTRGSRAIGVSGDGSIVVGRSATTTYAFQNRAFKWTATTGLVALEGNLNGSSGSHSTATDVSSDGSIILGHASMFFEENGSVFYSQGEGTVWDVRGARAIGKGIPVDLSANGTVAVGHVDQSPSGGNADFAKVWYLGEYGGELLRYRDSGGVVSGKATAVSGDGQVIVGYAGSANNSRAFIWTPDNGAEELAVFLAALGLTTDGLSLTTATGISDDGMRIVGWGYNPEGDAEGWIVTIPEPNTSFTLLLGLMVLARYRSSSGSERTAQ